MKQKRLFFKAAFTAMLIIIATFVSWELHLRSMGRGISYDDGASLWADKRKQIYEPADRSTVFIGSSRIKFDLDLPTWEQESGDHPIQLANVGSSPLLNLFDLAEDKQFKGKLILDITEFLFFTNAPYVNAKPSEGINYYRDETPSQKLSFKLNYLLESQFVFLDKEEYSLNALLGNTGLPDRKGVYELPNFPAGFTPVTFDRQCYMTDGLLNDTNELNQVKMIWKMAGERGRSMPPITEGATDSIIASVKDACDKIRARGGRVMFLRTPSSEPLWGAEKMAFPRAKFWDKILQVTGADGIHFEDYAELSGFQCPEFSHLSRTQAASFTKSLINILRTKGWEFPADRKTSSTPKTTGHGI